MDRLDQLEALNRMLADARRLTESGDPLLVGLYGSLEVRVRLLISLIDAEGQANDAA